MARTYYTLVFNEGGHLAEPWGITFGDYCRKTVKDELADLAESWGAPRKAFKIIETKSDTQAEIDAAVAALNEGESA